MTNSDKNGKKIRVQGFENPIWGNTTSLWRTVLGSDQVNILKTKNMLLEYGLI